ncbi:hypothetical protein ABT381_15660 [Streptomyces sp. NPDC000151]|uniref:hypothetical protein n=1 Tax=Streptomyces sp. NPDC000151 TaxID=3154244 RepID=UPI0033207687
MTVSHTDPSPSPDPSPRPPRRWAVLLWAMAFGLMLAAGLLVLSLCVPTLAGPLQTAIAGTALYAALVRRLIRRLLR